MNYHTLNGEGTGYLEYRRDLLKDCPQMAQEGRYYHLGIDVAAPSGTSLYAPSDAEIVVSEYEAGAWNYGGVVVLRMGNQYVLFGHLNPETLLSVGTMLLKGQKFAELGDESCNGGWFEHLHLQVLTQRGMDEGWMHKGYCSAADLPEMPLLCPDPAFIFDEQVMDKSVQDSI